MRVKWLRAIFKPISNNHCKVPQFIIFIFIFSYFWHLPSSGMQRGVQSAVGVTPGRSIASRSCPARARAAIITHAGGALHWIMRVHKLIKLRYKVANGERQSLATASRICRIITGRELRFLHADSTLTLTSTPTPTPATAWTWTPIRGVALPSCCFDWKSLFGFNFCRTATQQVARGRQLATGNRLQPTCHGKSFA